MTKSQESKSIIINKIKNMDTKGLCEAFEHTNNLNDDAVPLIRGFLMDELEERDGEKFYCWMNEEDPEKMDYPSKFFV